MDVKWIKIATSIFDNRKIRQIETLPEGDSIIVIWFKLLCLAGNVNDKGYIYFTSEIPYTEQMIATQFGRPLPIVQLALKTFEQFGMIEIIEDIIKVSSWEKYQNIEGMEKIREQTRKRVAKHRENQRFIPCNVTRNVTVTNGNATDIDKDIDIDKEKDNNIKKYYGELNNVLLTDKEYNSLMQRFPNDYKERIDTLSEYIESKGKKYKSHYATILTWARNEEKRNADKPKEYDLDYLITQQTETPTGDYF